MRHRCSRHAAKPSKLLGSIRVIPVELPSGPQQTSRRPVCMLRRCRPWACIVMGLMAIQGSPSTSPASDMRMLCSRGNQRHENGLVLAEWQPRSSSRQQDFRDIGRRGKPPSQCWPIWVANRPRNPMRPSWSSRPSPAQRRRFQGGLRVSSKEPRRCSRSVTPAVRVPPNHTPRCDTATRLGPVAVARVAGGLLGTWDERVDCLLSLDVRPRKPKLNVDAVVAVMAVIAVELSPSPADGNLYPRAWKAERVGFVATEAIPH